MATRKEGSPYWMIGVIGVAKAAPDTLKQSSEKSDVNEYVTNNAYSGDRGQIKETYKQLTLYTQTPSCISSILLSLHFLSC